MSGVDQMMLEPRTVVVDGIETGYLEVGPSDAPAIVLLHGAGLGMGAAGWFPAAEPLTAQHRVVAIDLLGYGRTRKVVFFDRSAQAQRIEHVAATCAALGIDRAHVVGHSMGGGLVLQAAIEGSLPIDRAVSIAGPGGIMLDRARMAEVQTSEPDHDWAVRAMEVGVPDPSPALVADRLARASAPDHIAVMGAVGALNRLHPRPADHEARFRAGLARIACPVLLIAGDDDPFALSGWERELAAEIPDCRTHVVAGGRHEPQTSHPDEVMRRILDFLDHEG